MEDKLTLELLKDVRANGKRWMKACIFVLVLLFLTNIAWMIAWNLPSEGYTVEQHNEDEGDNNIIGNNGDINDGTLTDDKSNQKK